VPELKASLKEAISDRGIASVANANSKMPVLQEEEREHWMHWASSRMTELQHYSDYAEERVELRGARAQLLDAATQLVAFYGYAAQGNRMRMRATLDAVREHEDQAFAAACPGN
jgi:hypothetical protein